MPRSKVPAYASGEDIHPGDNILYHGERGKVEFVAVPGDPKTDWYVEQYGSGCMLLVPSFGRVFLATPDNDEDLEFLERGELRHNT
jgi:hypothetical protein